MDHLFFFFLVGGVGLFSLAKQRLTVTSLPANLEPAKQHTQNPQMN